MKVARLIVGCLIVFLTAKSGIMVAQANDYAVLKWTEVFKPTPPKDWFNFYRNWKQKEKRRYYDLDEWRRASPETFRGRCKSLQLFRVRPGKPRELFGFRMDPLLRHFGVKHRKPQIEWIGELPQQECMWRHKEFVTKSGEARVEYLQKRGEARAESLQKHGIELPGFDFRGCGNDQRRAEHDCAARFRQDAIEEFLQHDLTAQVCAGYLAQDSDDKFGRGACLAFPIPSKRHAEWKAFLGLIVSNWSKSLLRWPEICAQKQIGKPSSLDDTARALFAGDETKAVSELTEAGFDCSEQVAVKNQSWRNCSTQFSYTFFIKEHPNGGFAHRWEDKLNISFGPNAAKLCVWRGKKNRSEWERRRYCDKYPSDCG